MSRNGAVQMFFLKPNKNMFPGKSVKRQWFLAVFQEYIVFNVKKVEVRKQSEGFFVKIYYKMGDLFC